MKVLCKVAYKGTNYQGWQKQTNAPSVQETIEKVLSKILNEEITIQGSGRTDAGVHAVGQYFHFVTSKNDTDLSRLRYSSNCLLPNDIAIQTMQLVSDDFHARFNAKSKTYSYIIRLGERNVFNNKFECTLPMEVDVNKLKSAVELFKGKHNFQDFNSKEEDEDNFVREIYDVNFVHAMTANQVVITFKGNGFMRYQIRDMVGAAIAISQGKEDLDYIKYHLKEDKVREITNYKAPSSGLFLIDVEY